jgi:DNA-binding GntR family transcriptional regulator
MERQHGPLGERLRNALASAIDAGLIPPGESLPAEREMSERLEVSRSTLRQGLKDLAQMGLVATRPGAGTVVVGHIPKALSRLSGFTEDMQLRGLLPTSKVLERSIGPVDPDAAFRTGLPLGTSVPLRSPHISASAKAPPCWRFRSSAIPPPVRSSRTPSAGIAAIATNMSARSGAEHG